jgi:hypothetical protein
MSTPSTPGPSSPSTSKGSARPKPEVMLRELEAAAERMKVRVSYEALQGAVGAGGLCRVKGAYRVIMDKRSQTGERVATLAQALGEVGVPVAELSPAVREQDVHFSLRRAS